MTLNPLIDLEKRLACAAHGVDEIEALNALAWELRERDVIRAHDLAEQALLLSRSTGVEGLPYPQGAAQALVNLGELAISSDAHGLALTYLLEAYTLIQDLPSSELLADASHSIGWAHLRLGNYAEATDFLQQALKIYQDIGNKEKETAIFSSLGSVYSTQGNHSEAMRNFQCALALTANQADTRTRCVTLNNLANAQIRLGANQEALTNAQLALEISRKLGLAAAESSILDTLGQIYLALGDTKNAEEVLCHSLEIARRMAFEHHEMVVMLNLASVYRSQSHSQQAYELLTQAIALADVRHLNPFRYKYYEILAMIDEERGDFKNALLHYKEYHAAKDLALNESANYRLENLRILHQVGRMRKEAEILWLQNRDLEQEIAERRKYHAELQKLATTDPLTGICNRRHFYTLGEYELEKARRSGLPLSLIMLDIDSFKLVNDRYSHSTGDQTLIALTRLILDNARKGDVACRYGGEEFTLLLPETNQAHAQEVAERIRLAVCSLVFPVGTDTFSITASLGVAQVCDQDTNFESLIDRADQALLRAKSSGKNRVSI
jgi:diguanylate cyclase (GGDEF)-like protein